MTHLPTRSRSASTDVLHEPSDAILALWPRADEQLRRGSSCLAGAVLFTLLTTIFPPQQNLFVGSTLRSDPHFTSIEGIIPNSQVVVSPPSGKGGSSWRWRLYLHPSDFVPWVSIFVVLTTLALCGVVTMLHRKEQVRLHPVLPTCAANADPIRMSPRLDSARTRPSGGEPCTVSTFLQCDRWLSAARCALQPLDSHLSAVAEDASLAIKGAVVLGRP